MTDIIIPQFNNAGYTVKCLETIKRYTDNYKILFIDNGSFPDQLVLAQAALEDMPHKLIRNKTNLGFVRATNQGIRQSTAPFVVLLNNDTEVEPHWLDRLLEVFEKEPRAGLVGPTTIWADSWQNRMNLLAKARTQSLTGYRRIDSMLAFFCVAIKREVFDRVGLLDEEYDLGFADDDDFCERAKRAGFRLFIHYDVTIPHYHRTTFNAFVPNWQEKQKENIAKFRQKWNNR